MMLDAFSAPGRFLRGNLHGHSTNSDGYLPVEDVCRRYREAGYDFICLSDHFLKQFDYPITDSRPYRTSGFTTLIGAELHLPAISSGDIWHILAVGLPFDFAPPLPGEDGPAIARRAREAGAFVAIPHPHWNQLTPEDGISLDAAHAVEAYNHSSALHSDRGDGVVLFDKLTDLGRRLGLIAVDDSHFWIQDGLGKRPHDDAAGGWVMVKARDNEPEAILAALKAGHYYASQGPEIHSIRRVGDSLVLKSSQAATYVLAGSGCHSVVVHGDGLEEASLPLKGLGRWCRATVVDDRGRKAWSNPLFLM